MEPVNSVITGSSGDVPGWGGRHPRGAVSLQAPPLPHQPLISAGVINAPGEAGIPTRQGWAMVGGSRADWGCQAGAGPRSMCLTPPSHPGSTEGGVAVAAG